MDEFRRRPINRANPQTPPSVAGGPSPSLGPTPQSSPQPVMHRPVSPITAPQSLDTTALPIPPEKKKKSVKKRLIWWLVGIFAAAILAIAGLFTWYTMQLRAVDPANTGLEVITVEKGSAPSDIADLLEKEGVIRNATAFLWYTRFEGVQNSLQAGVYRLSPSESTQQIVEHLVSGRVDTFNVTLYPGATLVDTTDKEESKKYDVTTALKRAGYTDEQITAGLNADYSEYNDNKL